MSQISGKIAWVTGAGSGIGAAAALALAGAGATVVLTGRRVDRLEQVAARIRETGGVAHVQPGDLSSSSAVEGIASWMKTHLGRVDILVNNAGLNILERDWKRLTPASVDQVIGGNLASAFYCVTAVLPMMRAQQDGVLIHTASIAGRFVSLVSGGTYSAVKHGVVAMSHSINMEECINGIRSTAICPGEVATEILDKRPVPVSAADRARMLQAEDCADLILYVASLPPHVCLNEVVITPTWNRGYVAALK
jgi:NADP-dependent 3-hydroxy acid dehydrogenase YdfG